MTRMKSTGVAVLVTAVAAVVILMTVSRLTPRTRRSVEPQVASDEYRGDSPYATTGELGEGKAKWRQGNARQAQSGRQDKAGSQAKHLPRKTMVLLEDGRLVPAVPGKSKLGDPGVLAEVYEGAPIEAVKKLHHILRSGSNETADFTRTERYPDWVYEKMNHIGPGKLGEALAFLARYHASQPAESRAVPMLDFAPESYGELRGPARPAGAPQDYGIERLAAIGGTPVAEIKDGLVYVWGHGDEATPLDLAVWIAHRLAAGDTELRVPDLPPPPWQDWESWIRDHTGPPMQKEMEDAGILPKKDDHRTAAQTLTGRTWRKDRRFLREGY
ncbi:MAG: hypothetical protein ACP5R4_06285 [Armatimonadota bacterium]